MKRIIDANLNRANEAYRVIEEITRFFLNNKGLSEKLKIQRHAICMFFDKDYESLLNERNIREDVGTDISNPDKRNGIESIFKANIKRLEEALRVLGEYGGLDDKYRYAAYNLECDIYKELKMNLKKYLLENRKLYLVTNSDNFKSEDEFLDAIAQALKGGVDILQYREKSKNAAEIIKTGKKIRDLCSSFNTLFIVNDRVDVAKILNADGVHLGQEDIDIKSAREILGEKAIIGISTHKPLDAKLAEESGADYIGVGPVFKTPTKPLKTPTGLEYVRWAKENVSIPFFAIGAIDKDNLQEVIDAGATRVAAIRAIMYAENPTLSAEKFKELL